MVCTKQRCESVQSRGWGEEGGSGVKKQLVGGRGEVGRGRRGGTKIRGGEVGGNGDEEQSKETKKVKVEIK
ncbi:hypothetical protein PMAC_001354 [Pneumocystis sp. 'macacae']|nr:hypothetical protein PMAC_001354 [Pneumocystis sp. 'macacae']